MLRLRAGHRESRLLPVSSQPDAVDDWPVLSLDCPRRGRIGLELCVDCPLFWRAREEREGARQLVVECGYRAPETVRSATKLRLAGHAEVISSLLPRERFCLVPELGIHEVANLFRSRGLEHAPVVDSNQRPIGVVCRDDLGERPGPCGLATIVGDIMRSPELILSEDTSIVDAAALILARRASYVIVLSGRGQVLGSLSAPLARGVDRSRAQRVEAWTSRALVQSRVRTAVKTNSRSVSALPRAP